MVTTRAGPRAAGSCTAGPYTSFRLSHRQGTLEEAHGNDGFLLWHRAYILDQERGLQEIDRRVTLPYWRFDRPAPNLFTRDWAETAARCPDSPTWPPATR